MLCSLPRMKAKIFPLFLLPLLLTGATAQNDAPTSLSEHPRGQELINRYFHSQVDLIESKWLTGIETLSDWEERRPQLRRQLQEMLGLLPFPERTDLKATVTGTIDGGDFVVEKLHFQSLPQLYVSANLYRPKEITRPLPAILYLCGHARVKENGIAYGNKVHYHHHPAWFARHGYVSLIIDTIQLGEIEGIHHGTYREGMWWWNARGYTPAGVETWNAMRALDYLQARSEVDSSRIGVTGRSGGGAYAWFLAALDDRVEVAVPVAGMTDLRSHVVDGVIEGHCDCMFMVNTYRWDFPLVAALVAPRPLLLANSDKDRIFPLNGVERLHRKLRQIYRLYEAQEQLGLVITEGPHKDTQELRIPAFHWMNRWLKGKDPLIEETAIKFFEPQQLKVFSRLPSDEKTSRIHESFVPRASDPPVPTTADQWQNLRSDWMRQLTEKSFAGWPEKAEALNVRKISEAASEGLRLQVYDFDSQREFPLRLWLLIPADSKEMKQAVLHVVDETEWRIWMEALSQLFPAEDIQGRSTEFSSTRGGLQRLTASALSEAKGVAILGPRGVGLTRWDSDPNHIRRRFVLLGQTLDAMRVWDVRRAIQVLQDLHEVSHLPLSIQARDRMAAVALYATLFETHVQKLDLSRLPSTHREGPDFLNVLKILDLPQALAMVLSRVPVNLYEAGPEAWQWARKLGEHLSIQPLHTVQAPAPGHERN